MRQASNAASRHTTGLNAGRVPSQQSRTHCQYATGVDPSATQTHKSTPTISEPPNHEANPHHCQLVQHPAPHNWTIGAMHQILTQHRPRTEAFNMDCRWQRRRRTSTTRSRATYKPACQAPPSHTTSCDHSRTKLTKHASPSKLLTSMQADREANN